MNVNLNNISDRSVSIALAFIAAAHVSVRYVQVDITGSREIGPDVVSRWQPVARAVLNENVPLYIKPAVDNKPPIFQYLNLAAALTGEYLLAWYIIIAICNAVTAILLYAWVKKGAGRYIPDGRATGFLAALLFLSTLYFVGGATINARSPMLVGVMYAVYTESQIGRGAGLATGALCSQYAVLAAPVFVYESFQDGRIRAVLKFAIGGIVVVMLAYLPLLVIWGPASTLGGVTNGIFSQYRPITSQPQQNILVNPSQWLTNLLSLGNRLFFVWLLTAVALLFHIWATIRRERYWYSFPIALTVIYFTPLLIKTLGYYALHALPFAAVLSSGLIVDLVSSDSTRDGQ